MFSANGPIAVIAIRMAMGAAVRRREAWNDHRSGSGNHQG